MSHASRETAASYDQQTLRLSMRTTRKHTTVQDQASPHAAAHALLQRRPRTNRWGVAPRRSLIANHLRHPNRGAPGGARLGCSHFFGIFLNLL